MLIYPFLQQNKLKEEKRNQQFVIFSLKKEMNFWKWRKIDFVCLMLDFLENVERLTIDKVISLYNGNWMICDIYAH